MEKSFRQKQVELSFRRFRDFASDVFDSDFHTFDSRFDILVHHCENDEVMKIITSQLKEIDTNFQEWWERAQNTGGSMIGSKQLSLPIDERKRDALMYQLILKIQNKKINFAQFCMDYFGETNYNAMIVAFNDGILRPLIRSIIYKLEEISDEITRVLSKQQDVPTRMFLVYQDYSVNVGDGNVISAEVVGHKHDSSVNMGDGNVIQEAAIGEGAKFVKISEGEKQFNKAPGDIGLIETISKLLINHLGFWKTIFLDIIALLGGLFGIPIGLVSSFNIPSNSFTNAIPIGFLPRFPEYSSPILIGGFLSFIVFIIISDSIQYYRTSRCPNCGRDFALREYKPRKVHDVEAVDAVYRQEKRYKECRFCHDKFITNHFYEIPYKKSDSDD